MAKNGLFAAGKFRSAHYDSNKHDGWGMIYGHQGIADTA
jgi:hypothetical protein